LTHFWVSETHPANFLKDSSGNAEKNRKTDSVCKREKRRSSRWIKSAEPRWRNQQPRIPLQWHTKPRATRYQIAQTPSAVDDARQQATTDRPEHIAGNIRMPFSVGSGSPRRSFGAATKNAAVQETAKVGTK
jgi:hypothetical protein